MAFEFGDPLFLYSVPDQVVGAGSVDASKVARFNLY